MSIKITKTYFMLPVDDMDRATGFYRDVLGLAVQFASPDWTELTWRDATIALHRAGSRDQRDRWLGFEVDDLDAALAAIEAAGGQRGADRNEGGVRLVSITDTEGNGLTIGGLPTGG
jgi:predicted enzyme related to lactoylglutathione lyase